MAEANEHPTPLLSREWLFEVRDRLTEADGLLLCLDFDGTLAPIVENPGDSMIPTTNKILLRLLADDPATTVAIVSGRSLTDLRQRVDLDGIHYAGNYGLEWTGPDSDVENSENRTERKEVQDVLDELRPLLSGISGCVIEDKTLTATVHYRQVADTEVSKVIEITETVVQSSPGLQCKPGKKCLEVRPDTQVGKDRAVDRLRNQYPDFLPLFVGDDTSDEDGFQAVGHDGLTVLVGDRPDTTASVRVPDPKDVTLLLAWLVQTTVGSATLPDTV